MNLGVTPDIHQLDPSLPLTPTHTVYQPAYNSLHLPLLRISLLVAFLSDPRGEALASSQEGSASSLHAIRGLHITRDREIERNYTWILTSGGAICGASWSRPFHLFLSLLPVKHALDSIVDSLSIGGSALRLATTIYSD